MTAMTLSSLRSHVERAPYRWLDQKFPDAKAHNRRYERLYGDECGGIT